MPTRAQLRELGLTREEYEAVIGDHSDSEEETKDERDDTEDEEESENEFDFTGLEEEDFEGLAPFHRLNGGNQVPTGQTMRNLYKASDHCKRHRPPGS